MTTTDEPAQPSQLAQAAGDHVPKGWEKKESKSKPGKFYYYNTATKERSWEMPSAAAAGGEKHGILKFSPSTEGPSQPEPSAPPAFTQGIEMNGSSDQKAMARSRVRTADQNKTVGRTRVKTSDNDDDDTGGTGKAKARERVRTAVLDQDNARVIMATEHPQTRKEA